MNNKRIISIFAAMLACCGIALSSAHAAEPEEKDFTPEFVAQCKSKAEAGDAEGQALYGRALANGWGVASNHVEAVRWLSKAADAGNAIGQCSLGVCYGYGEGVEKDAAKAVEWYRKAAEQGLARAQCYLGVCYECGTGVEKDDTKAVEWYRKAAEQGYAQAQCNLGVCYGFGTGVEKDEAKAVEWYRKAAEQGYAQAQCNLGICCEYGTGVEKDAAKAVEWYRKAAEQGYAQAQCNLGICCEYGTGVEKDAAKAVEWYRKAAEQGLAQAQCNLGVCYEFGRGVEKDASKAVEWYRKAAEDGDARGQCNLANCYEFGNGVKMNESKAAEWYSKAADQGYARGQGSLGVCYEFGKGVDRDIVKAIELYSKAIEQGDARAYKRYGWTTNDTESFWVSAAASSRRVTTEPRLKDANSEKGEGMLEAFGTRYMPNAYDYYEKVRATAIEREQKLKENFPNGATWSNADVYEKIRKATVKAVAEYFRRRDELCHFYLVHKAGILNDADLAKIDEARICVMLPQIRDTISGIPGYYESAATMKAEDLDFARRFKPESFSIYERLKAQLEEGIKDYKALQADARILDAVRGDGDLAPLAIRLDDILKTLRRYITITGKEKLLHDVDDISAEQLADSDGKSGVELREFESQSSVRDYANWYFETRWTVKECREVAEREAPVFALSFMMIPIPDKYYAICKYEVTQLLWETVMGNNPSEYKSPNCPVENVSWKDCNTFIKRLNEFPEIKALGYVFRLPTLEEWQVACGAGTTNKYCRLSDGTEISDKTISQVAWVELHYDDGLHPRPIGLKKPNAFGLYDMLGNVSEWTSNFFRDSSTLAICCGGYYYGTTSLKKEETYNIDKVDHSIGFRLARDATDTERTNLDRSKAERQAAKEREEAERKAAADKAVAEASVGAVAKLAADMVPMPQKNYAICKYEVTQALWFAVMGENPSHFKGGNLPVESVSWDDFQKFLGRLNALPEVKEKGYAYRLPTVDEWEYACLAGGKKGYCKLDGEAEITETTLEDVAWFNKNASEKSHPVGQKRANAFGLYDMHGNVFEWTASFDNDGDPIGLGGCILVTAKGCSVSGKNRLGQPSSTGLPVIGFRIVRGLTPDEQRKAEEEQQGAIVKRSEGLTAKLAGDMVLIPGKNYFMCKYEVTKDLYGAITGKKGYSPNEARQPISYVSWNDIQGFIETLNSLPQIKASGFVYRLPTFEEWQYACRADARGRFCKLEDGTEITEETLGMVAWTAKNSGKISHPVGQKMPNAFGLYDMIGNVWEWSATSGSALGIDRLAYGSSYKDPSSMDSWASDLSRYIKNGRCLAPNWIGEDLGFRLAADRISAEDAEKSKAVIAALPSLMVTIPGQGYAVCKYEVSQELWKAIMGSNPSHFKGDQRPVESVSFVDCQKFIKKLNATPEVKASGYVYRLPTIREWEYACRAGSKGKFGLFEKGRFEVGSGKEITIKTLVDAGWLWDNSGGETHPVGQKKPNAFGLYDMLGNVREWSDTPDEKFPTTIYCSGSSWRCGGTEDGRNIYCMEGYVWSEDQNSGPNDLGFRLAADKIEH